MITSSHRSRACGEERGRPEDQASGRLACHADPGSLLAAGELPGAPVIEQLVPRRDSVLIIRYAGR
jgi:hypothetical protein